MDTEMDTTIKDQEAAARKATRRQWGLWALYTLAGTCLLVSILMSYGLYRS
jgi:hypothetical protein